MKIWFDMRYGDLLKVDLSLGQVVILIKQDPYGIRLPKIYGQVVIVADPSLPRLPRKKIFVPALGREIQVLNSLCYIEGLTPHMASLLKQEELDSIVRFAEERIGLINKLAGMSQLKFVKEARYDLGVAVDAILAKPHQFKQSKWATLQFVEKLLKGFISQHNANKFTDTEGLQDI